jgi:predicted Fe-Mo cluster-binding NifX family protein
MKIALTSTGRELTSAIDPRFGRCNYFIVVDTDSMDVEVFQNENKELDSGAGIQTATFIASKGVQAVITGNCGPNAIEVLSTAGIDLYTGEGGKTVNESMQRLINGSLLSFKATGSADDDRQLNRSTAEKSRQYIPPGGGQRGMGMGSGRGMGGRRRGAGMRGGRGMGSCRRGTGMGGGRGMGMGGGRGMR